MGEFNLDAAILNTGVLANSLGLLFAHVLSASALGGRQKMVGSDGRDRPSDVCHNSDRWLRAVPTACPRESEGLVLPVVFAAVAVVVAAAAAAGRAPGRALFSLW